MTHLIDDACCISCCTVATAAVIIKLIKSEFSFPESKDPRAESKEIASKQGMLLRAIEDYQKDISPAIKKSAGIGRICRYTPSCSEYAWQSILYHGSMRGALLAMERLARCNPFSIGGYDPVPL